MSATEAGGAASADRSASRTTLFSLPPPIVFNRLARWGRIRFVTGNAAVRVEGTCEVRGMEEDGSRVALSGGAGLWLFPEHWDNAVVVTEPCIPDAPVVFRFIHRSGGTILEVMVDAETRAAGGPNWRTTLARWRASGFSMPIDRRRDAPGPQRPTTFGPGMETELARARKHGDAASVRALVLRHGLSRIEALSLLGHPWAQRVVPFGPRALLEQIAKRGLAVQLLIGNEGLTFVRTGALPLVQPEGRNVLLRDSDLEIKVRSSFLESLWAVRLRSEGHEISSLESYDADGNPALLVFGAPEKSGGESLAWQAFVDRRRLCGGGRGGVGIRMVPDPCAARGRGDVGDEAR